MPPEMKNGSVSSELTATYCVKLLGVQESRLTLGLT
jgi:hypothetical protein